MKVNGKIDINSKTYYYNKFIFNEQDIEFIILNLDKSINYLKNKLNVGWKSINDFVEYNKQDNIEDILSTKKCNTCNLIKDISLFREKSFNSIKSRISICKKCENKKTILSRKKKIKPIKPIVSSLYTTPTSRVFLGEYIYYSNRSGLNDDLAITIYLALKTDTKENISKLFNINYFTIKAFDNLNKYNNRQELEGLFIKNSNKQCNICLSYKQLSEFYFRRNYYEKMCLMCKAKSRRYYLGMSDKEKREKKLRKTPHEKLRHNVSKSIYKMIKSQKSTKDGESILKYLDYSFNDLIKHIESLFDDKMNWNNYGKYVIGKYTWQLDHIKCQSDYPYTSMEDENFKIVWALDNLRPLEARQNILDGLTRVRHLK